MRQFIDLVENILRSSLTEAPIGNLEVHNMDKPGTFSDADRKLLTNPAHIAKIRKHFELNTFEFDLYFVNQPNVSYVASNANFTKKWSSDLKAYAGISSEDVVEANFGVTIALNPDAITIVYLSNANEENSIPMTPWIVAHRFGHALTDKPLPRGIAYPYDQIPKYDRMPFNDLYRAASDSPIKQWLDANQEFRMIRLVDMLTMRSMRKSTLNSGETFEELIAQYLITGKISLRMPANWQNVSYRTADDLKMANNLINQLGNRLTVLIDKLMNACVSHLFITV